jgi:hypothetical protein
MVDIQRMVVIRNALEKPPCLKNKLGQRLIFFVSMGRYIFGGQFNGASRILGRFLDRNAFWRACTNNKLAIYKHLHLVFFILFSAFIEEVRILS